MLGDVASRIGLDEEVEVALVLIGGDGRVRANDFLGLACDSSGERNVLADGEAEDVGLARELEPVTSRLAPWSFGGWGRIHGGVVREYSLLFKFKLLEIGRLQHLARSCSDCQCHPLSLVQGLRTTAVCSPSSNKCYQQHSV